MTPDPERDGLDGALEHEPYLDDDGFTARVMAGLPGRRHDPRLWVLGLSGAAAAVTALLVLPDVVRAGLRALAAVPWPVAAAPAVLVGLVATAAAMAIVGLVVALEA
jgi:hypothetical protein